MIFEKNGRLWIISHLGPDLFF